MLITCVNIYIYIYIYNYIISEKSVTKCGKIIVVKL